MIVAVTVIGGALGVLLFEPAFTLFHELFFPGGNWQFDPRTDRLVQLFPVVVLGREHHRASAWRSSGSRSR